MASDIPSFMQQDQEDYETKMNNKIKNGLKGFKLLGRTRGLEVYINKKDTNIILKDNDILVMSVEYIEEFGGISIDYIERYKPYDGLQWDLYELLLKKKVAKFVLTGGLLSAMNLRAHQKFMDKGSKTLRISLVSENRPNVEIPFKDVNDILKSSSYQFKIELI
jgi:hypothetical protein